MGQNVNYLLGGQNQLLGADPELYRQQLIQQEQARIAAVPQQSQLGATIGSMLGRGIGNLATGNNFFEITNPVLQKLTKIQNIYDTSMKEADPNDPMSFYTTLQKNFADAGLGQQAMMAQVEAKKFEDMNLKTEAARTEVYKNNLPLLNSDIAKFRAAGNDKKADELSAMLGQFQVKEDRAAALQTAEIALKGAQTEAQRAQASKLYRDVEEGKVTVTTVPDKFGGATIVFSDKNGNIIKEHKVQSPIMTPDAGTPGATPAPKTETPGSWKIVPTPVPGAK